MRRVMIRPQNPVQRVSSNASGIRQPRSTGSLPVLERGQADRATPELLRLRPFLFLDGARRRIEHDAGALQFGAERGDEIVVEILEVKRDLETGMAGRE